MSKLTSYKVQSLGPISTYALILSIYPLVLGTSVVQKQQDVVSAFWQETLRAGLALL